MAVNVDVKEDKYTVDIQDVEIYSIEVVDLSDQGSITVVDSTLESQNTDIQTTVTSNNILLPTETNVNVEISSTDTTQIVTHEVSDPHVIEITDNIAINDAIVSTATNRAARALTAWSATGADIFYNTGNVGIGTSQINHKLDVSGSVKATSFKGIFEGALSGSAQIASQISSSIQTHPSVIELEFSASTNDNLIRANLDRILKTESSASSISIRLEAVEAGSTSKTLISGSAQIATEISGAFEPASASLSSRITLVEAGSTLKTLISSSAQIASEISGAFQGQGVISGSGQLSAAISGAFKNVSSSIQSRLNTIELNYISSSGEIKLAISGAFGDTSQSIQTRLTTIESKLPELDNTLISGSAQIASAISGAFGDTSQSIQTRLNTIESELSNTLISGSAQISSAISGAFGKASESIQTRLNTIELNYISSSGEIASNVSGAFGHASESLQTRLNVIESRVTQDVNSDSSVSFLNVSSSRVTASHLLVHSDTRLFGSFVLNGMEIFEDRVVVRSGSSIFGSGSMPSEVTHQFTGSILNTGSIIVTNGSITAPTFHGIFKGALSGSAQIASAISGSFTKASASIQTRLNVIESGYISASSQISSEISGAFVDTSQSIQTRLNTIESELSNTLISGSAQIASEVSGAFTELSSSIQTRLNTIESKTLISGSIQIASAISGAFGDTSSSIQTRLNTIESELNNTLISGSAQIASAISGAFQGQGVISGSAQIASEISGAFFETSESIQSRLNTIESKTLISSSGQLSTAISGALFEASSSIQSRLNIIESKLPELDNTLISGSAQIASAISGAFNVLPFSSELDNSVVVYNPTTKKFFYTGSYANTNITSTSTAAGVQYRTGSVAPAADLTELIINDYSNNVSVTTDGGTLTLTFGNPADPRFDSFQDDTYETNRFSEVTDSYDLIPLYNLYDNTFVFGHISASTNGGDYVGVSDFANGSSISINYTLPFYQTGSHTFKAIVRYQPATGPSADLIAFLPLELNKLNPTSPTLSNITYVIEHDAFNAEQFEIEEGAEGTISWITTPGDANGANGWVQAVPGFSNFSNAVTVTATNTPTTGIIEQYWNSSTNHNELISYTGSVSASWERVRSLRYISTMIPSYSTEEIQELDNWTSGTIKYGFNKIPEIESCTIAFNPSATGEYLYIIYDADLGDVTSIKNVDSTFEEISGFNVTIVGNYKVWRTVTPKDIPLNYKLEF